MYNGIGFSFLAHLPEKDCDVCWENGCIPNKFIINFSYLKEKGSQSICLGQGPLKKGGVFDTRGRPFLRELRIQILFTLCGIYEPCSDFGR